ncbi:MAG: N-acetylglucosamine-6-phosphate deacetylase [Chloroflexota bacterium]
MTEMIITNGCIVTPDGVLDNGWIQCEQGKIQAIGQGNAPDGNHYDAQGSLVFAGFVDIHVHGANSYDTMDASIDSLLAMSAFFAKQGVTSFLPTTLTASNEQTTQALLAIKEAMPLSHDGARIIGAHLEGPYLHPDKSGAQNKEFIRPIDREEFQAWLDLDVIRLVSVAPEQEDIAWLIETCQQYSVTVSAAHTTAAYETAQQAIDVGLSHATHTYNAMPQLHHRTPGALAALFLSSDVNCELIADNVHVHPAMMALLLQIVGIERLILITDAMRATGMADGEYDLGDYAVTVKDKIARLDDGTLAGSTLTMNRALLNFSEAVKQPITDLWCASSYNASQAIGLGDKIGSIQVGYDADFAILGAESPHHVLATISQGKLIYESEH